MVAPVVERAVERAVRRPRPGALGALKALEPGLGLRAGTLRRAAASGR
ncbi:Hypothetical protein AA314_07536 [Archangium gephyra]|uniref:Uncharacterized protein n=1 Tax=Archangium gephyra TaxID=48 RepID=A0AAC8THI6_9BACT|nr:Hypothetical protein AA314_07536 [Archangium gephyra]